MRNLVASVGLLAVVGSAPAGAVDLDGPWHLDVRPIGLSPFACPASVVQVGTTISLDAPTCTFALAVSGTIDPGTGTFSGSGTATGAPLCPTISVTGMGSTTSDAFWGDYVCDGTGLGGSFTGSLCGNGVVDAGEDCDDGDVQVGDCCSHDCRFDPNKSVCGPHSDACESGTCNGAGTCTLTPDAAGSPCFRDTNECTDDVCDGAGTCTHPNRPAGALCFGDFNECTDGSCNGAGSCVLTDNTDPCDDFNACTLGDVCAGGSCVPGTPAAAGTTCEADADLCTLETCDAGGGCLATGACSDCCGGGGCRPAPGTCKGPIQPGAKVLLRSQLGVKDQLAFRWKRGESTVLSDLGNPLGGTDYTLCVYDETPSGVELSYRAMAPAGGTCAGAPCWRANGLRGFTYQDPQSTPDGLGVVKLKVGPPGKASALAKGRGANLRVPFLGDGTGGGLHMPVTVQLRSSDAACFDATFATAQRDGPYEFRSKDGQ
jgi:hypothetical protein